MFGVINVKLGEVCNFLVGGDIPKESYSAQKTEFFHVPIYGNGVGNNSLCGYTNKKIVKRPCVTIAARGTIGYCALRTEPFFPVVRLICALPNNSILVGFLKYAIEVLKFQVPTAGIPQLTIPMLKTYSIPLPPLEEQQRIVLILDRFDALCNDL